MAQKNIKDVKNKTKTKIEFDGHAGEFENLPESIRIPITLKNFTNLKWLKIKREKKQDGIHRFSRVIGAAGEVLIPTENLKVVSDPYTTDTRKEFTNLILTDPIAAPAHTFLIGSLFENGFTLQLVPASQFDEALGRELTPEEIDAKLILEAPNYAKHLGHLITWKNDAEIEQLAKDLVSVALPQGKAAGQVSPGILELSEGQLPILCEIIPADDLGSPIIDIGINRKLVAVKINTGDDDDKSSETKDILRADELVYMTIGTRGLRRESKFQGVSRLEPILQISLALKKYYQLHAPLAMISAYIAKQLVKVKPDQIDDATASRVNNFMTNLFKANTWAMSMPDWYDGVDIVKPEVDWDMFSGIENKLATVELAQLGVPKSSQNREQDLNRDIATIQAIQFVRFTRKPLEELVMKTLENQLFNPLFAHLCMKDLKEIPLRIKVVRKESGIDIDKIYDNLSQNKNTDITNGNLEQNNAQTIPEVPMPSSSNPPIGAAGKILEKQMVLLEKQIQIEDKKLQNLDKIHKISKTIKKDT